MPFPISPQLKAAIFFITFAKTDTEAENITNAAAIFNIAVPSFAKFINPFDLEKTRLVFETLLSTAADINSSVTTADMPVNPLANSFQFKAANFLTEAPIKSNAVENIINENAAFIDLPSDILELPKIAATIINSVIMAVIPNIPRKSSSLLKADIFLTVFATNAKAPANMTNDSAALTGEPFIISLFPRIVATPISSKIITDKPVSPIFNSSKLKEEIFFSTLASIDIAAANNINPNAAFVVPFVYLLNTILASNNSSISIVMASKAYGSFSISIADIIFNATANTPIAIAKLINALD